MTTVLFVCTGNICRSPMAEYLARSSHRGDVGFASAGTHAVSGSGPSRGSVEVLAEVGIDISAHRAQSFFDAVPTSDIILVLAQEHLEILRARWPERTSDVLMLRPDGRSIADPYRRPLADYRVARDEIQAAVAARTSLWDG